MHRATFVALVLLLGCGPQGPMGIVPGGPFLGLAEDRADFSASDDHLLVAIEILKCESDRTAVLPRVACPTLCSIVDPPTRLTRYVRRR